MEFADEEPLTMLDARVAIGLPIEPDDRKKPRAADPGLMAKIGQRALDSEDKTPPSSPAVVLPKVAPPDPASAPLVAKKLTEAATSKPKRFRRPKFEGGDPTPGWLGPIALREYLLFSALILTFILASFFTKREQEIPIVRFRPAETRVADKPKAWQQALRETPVSPPRPEHFDPTPHLDPIPPPPEPVPQPPPPEASKAGAGRRLAMRYITVASNPRGASVSVNGINRGKTPFIESSMKELSKVEVEVSMEGYKTWRGTAAPNPAGHIAVSAKLERE